MTQYIVKRLLLMVPTFLLITIVVFVLINLAPGKPGASGNSQGSESADQSANQREGYRKFKEQYFLDKPILLNTRFRLERDDVEEELEIIARNMSGTVPGETEASSVGVTAANVLTGLVNSEYYAIQSELSAPDLSAEQRAEIQRRMQNAAFESVDPIRPDRPAQGRIRVAEDRVEDWGNDIVPALVSIASDYVYLYPRFAEDDDARERAETAWTEGRGFSASALGLGERRSGTIEVDGDTYVIHPGLTAKVRFLAIQRLSQNAQRRVVIREGEQGTEEEQAFNRQIVSENNRIRTWTYAIDASDATIAEVVGEWTTWLDENGARFERSGADRVRMFFFETRFARYWHNLARLDLGTSIRYRRPVLEVIADHWRYSIFLSLASLMLAYFISIPLGVLAAVKQNQFADRGIGVLLFVLYSLPSFFVASLLQTNLTGAAEADWLQWFPVAGFQELQSNEGTTWQLFKDIAWHLVLPVACLTYGALAVLSRYARTGLLDVIRSDYIRTARAKGLSEWIVILKHAVRNGMIPILTLLGTTLPVLIGGSIIIEVIFAIDGMGKLLITAIQFRDYNVIMGILLLSAVLTLIGILLSDISYALVDPRISFD